jgi:hypothetical protein
MQRAGQMAIEPTVGLLEDFVKKRTLCEFKFVQMYFQSGVAFVKMRKAVSDGKGGHIVIPAEKLRITFSPILDIKKPVTEAEVKVYQNRLMQMNPQLKPKCRDCIKAASEDPVAGNEYAWHTQNGYARSVVLKFPTFAAYCATGVCTLEKTIRKRKAEEPPPEAIKKTTTLLPGLKVSPYFKNVQPSQCPATSHDDSDEVVALERYTRRCNAGVIKPTQAGAGGGGANCGCEDGPHYFELGRFAHKVGSPTAVKGLL